jgi:hypothetical protein
LGFCYTSSRGIIAVELRLGKLSIKKLQISDDTKKPTIEEMGKRRRKESALKF